MWSRIKEFVKFGIVGAVNTILHLIIYWICTWIGIHYLAANAVGFVITVAISYILNNLFTFRQMKDGKVEWSFRTLLKVYISYFATGMVLNSVLLWFWNDCIGINKNLSPVLNLFITVPVNFLLNKWWAYRKTENTKVGKA